MARPSWEGNLRLSLVMCPVALYNATASSGEVHFNLLHKETHSRVRMIPHDPELGEVSRTDLVKGYEVEKGNYVVLSDEEIRSVRLPTSRTIEIERFVDEADIDRLYWDNPYYLVPGDNTGIEAYCVIRDAMRESGRVALGRVVMHNRERLLAIEPRGSGILLTTLRTRNEVRDAKTYFDEIPETKSDKKMLEIAEKIIEQQEGAFDPSEFKDRYEDALRALVAAKQKGRKIVAVAPAEPEKVIDLMAALKRSLMQSGGVKARAERFAKSRRGTVPARAERPAKSRAKPARSRKSA